MNECCWSFIGPSIQNGENKVGTVCESIIIGKIIQCHIWILKMMEEAELRWKISQVKYTFDNYFSHLEY